jgi:hypothetical protein
MTLRLGTRTLQSQRREHPAEPGYAQSLTCDVGMSKNVTASLTFVAGSAEITGANGTFANFVAGDPILVEGTNLNNGERIITGIDTVNSAYLVIDPPPKNEGPVTATVRTP